MLQYEIRTPTCVPPAGLTSSSTISGSGNCGSDCTSFLVSCVSSGAWLPGGSSGATRSVAAANLVSVGHHEHVYSGTAVEVADSNMGSDHLISDFAV